MRPTLSRIENVAIENTEVDLTEHKTIVHWYNTSVMMVSVLEWCDVNCSRPYVKMYEAFFKCKSGGAEFINLFFKKNWLLFREQ